MQALNIFDVGFEQLLKQGVRRVLFIGFEVEQVRIARWCFSCVARCGRWPLFVHHFGSDEGLQLTFRMVLGLFVLVHHLLDVKEWLDQFAGHRLGHNWLLKPKLGVETG